ncbi:MAG: ADOP family duplicated permease [Gemmatimonadales bacterium]
MPRLGRFARALRGLLWQPSVEDEVRDELAHHIAMRTRELIAEGLSAADARTEALRRFGDLDRASTLCTEIAEHRETTMRRTEWFTELTTDIRYALRRVRHAPGFSLVAVLTIALGIGANSAIFTVVNGVVLKPLPFAHPEQLLIITSQFPRMGLDHFPVDAAEFIEFRERNQSFQEVGAYVGGAVNNGAEGSPARVPAAFASASLFPALAVTPAAGRTFSQEETLPNASPTAVLSWELWQSAFGGKRSIVGESIDVDEVKTQVIGVMPPDFDVHDQGARIWLPLGLDPAQRQTYRGGHYLVLVGRLKPDVSPARAKTELDAMIAQWPSVDGSAPNATPGQPGYVHTPAPEVHRLRYDDLRKDTVGSIGTALWVLQCAVALVLLIACANVANLLLLRAESRHKELAVRAALGAGRWRLARQFVAESLVLAFAGAAVGLGLAHWGLRALIAANANSIPRAASVVLDGRVLLFTSLLALVTGTVFGFAPMLHLKAGSVGLALREAGSRTTAGTARNRVRRGLVVAEMSLAVMLVVGAGLLIKSFWNLMGVDSGFDRSGLVSFGVALPATPYADNARRVAFFDNLAQRLTAIPGVRAAAAMSGLPPRRPVNANDTNLEGYVPAPGAPPTNVDYYQYVTAGYLQTMGIPVVAGRSFAPSDVESSPPVVMINETLAKTFYKGQDPLGRHVSAGGSKTAFTIIGVVKDVKQGGLDSKTGTELYFAYPQLPRYLGFTPRSMNLVVRSSLASPVLASGIRRTISALDPSLPIVNLRSMDEVFSVSAARQRFLAQLLGIFAGVALALAAIGTYGVIAYAVNERTREIGIRIALGAGRTGVMSMVLAQGLSLAAVGVTVGLAGAAGLTRLVATLLFGVQPLDPATFAAVGGFMLLVALLACVVPARRAMRVDPLVAMRAD